MNDDTAIIPEVNGNNVLAALASRKPESEWYVSHEEFPIVIIGYGGETTICVDHSPLQSGVNNLLITCTMIDNPITIWFHGDVEWDGSLAKLREVLEERL